MYHLEKQFLFINSLNYYILLASDQNVDEAILDQSISLEDDSIITNEDNIIQFPPLSNDEIDAGNDYYGLSVSVSEAQNGQVSIDASNIITYSPKEEAGNYFENEKDELNVPEYLVKITKFSTSVRPVSYTHLRAHET